MLLLILQELNILYKASDIFISSMCAGIFVNVGVMRKLVNITYMN